MFLFGVILVHILLHSDQNSFEYGHFFAQWYTRTQFVKACWWSNIRHWGYRSSFWKMDIPFIHPRSLKEIMVYRGLVTVTCIICNDLSRRSKLATSLSKRWPLKRHNQPINAPFRRMFDWRGGVLYWKNNIRISTMNCKSQICLTPICNVRMGI